MSETAFAFLLTLFAGLATGLGGCVVFFTRVENKKILTVCLSFAAGVMLFISFAEILIKGFEGLSDVYGQGPGYLIGAAAFFGGAGLMALLDKLVPYRDKDLKRTGILSAAAIAAHNFPEGFITFMAAMYDPALGVVIAAAVAVHNIPEGIAMAAPYYYATGRKGKAAAVALASGLTEPLGGLIAWSALYRIFGEVNAIFGISFALVAGIMVFIALHQLLPMAYRYGKHALIIRWLFAGMAVMAVSLAAMGFAA